MPRDNQRYAKTNLVETDLKKRASAHTDLSRTDSFSIKEVDYVVIGSGAGGGHVAEALTLAGFKVLLVEEGPFRTTQDFKMQELQAYRELYQEVAARKTKDKGISILQGRAAGGGTTVNWTSSFRTPIQTLDHWQRRYGVERLGEAELSGWFERAEKRFHISPWRIKPNANNDLLAQGAKTLGWSFGTIARNVRGCANLGYCGMGCPIGAKQSMLVTTIPAALAQGAHLVSRARCDQLLVKGEQVIGVRLRAMTVSGQPGTDTHSVTAKGVFLCAGAIGSPAVMLRSQLPDPHERIGKRTFLHPVTASIAEFSRTVNPFYGAPQSVYSDQFLWPTDDSRSMGFKLEVPPIHPVIASMLFTEHGQQHAETMKLLPHMQATLALMRDGFHERSPGGRVLLDEHQYPVLDYPVDDYLLDTVAKAMLRMAELQFAAGARRVRPMHMDAGWSLNWRQAKQVLPQLKQKSVRTQLVSAHVMGGCAMGNDERQSVVDSTGKFHHLDNLWVMDGSIFPTSLGVNPQLSIFAMISKLMHEQVTDLP